MSDPWVDEWASMTYTERLNWWWSARSNYQSQEDFAAGKVAAEGVSCKYGIPGFLPGTRSPYNKPVTTPAPETEPVTPSETTETTKTTETTEPAMEDSKPVAAATSEDSKPATVEETTSTTSTSDDEKKAGTVNLIIPPGSSTLNVISNKKKKNKNKHR